MRPRQRRILAVVATPGTTDRLRSLARELARLVDVRSLDQVEGRPDAVLVASLASSAAAPAGVPVAVWVANAGEMASLGASHVSLSADRAAIDRGAIGVPADALDVVALAVMPPLVRSRRRQRDGLPPTLTVQVHGLDTGAGTMLGVAAAAVVSGPLLATALAIGTPTVTTPTEADRLGLRAGVEVEVTEADASQTLVEAIAADPAWAAHLSFAARRFAERTLDLGTIAAAVCDRLGLAAPPPGVLADRLAELATPRTAPIRARAARATAVLVEER